MIADGQDLIVTAPWLSLVPGIAIVITVLSLNVFGDGLRDALDPRAKVKIEHVAWLAFLVRRTFGAILVLLAVSFIVFLIFIVIPGGDPAQRIAGKNATQQNISTSARSWGFDRALLRRSTATMMQTAVQRATSSRTTTSTNVVQQIKAGMPATFSLAIGAGDHLALLRGPRGGDLGRQGRAGCRTARSRCSR